MTRDSLVFDVSVKVMVLPYWVVSQYYLLSKTRSVRQRTNTTVICNYIAIGYPKAPAIFVPLFFRGSKEI